jgi:hypothetical protein
MFTGYILLRLNNHQNSWNLFVIDPNTKFGVYFGSFYMKVGGYKLKLRTTNKLPHTYSFARPRAKLRDKSNHEHNILRYMAYIKVIPTHSLYQWDMWR